MFGTGNFVLVQNLVEDIKILNMRPFAAICDLCEGPLTQKDVKKLIGIKVLIQDIYKKTDYSTVIQNAKSHSEILFDVIWLCYDIFAYH